MAAVTICSDFGAPQNKVCHCFHSFWQCLTGLRDWTELNWNCQIHLMIEDQDLDLSAILAPFDSNRLMFYPWAKSFFWKLCPDTFPPVTVPQILMELLQMPKAETEVSFFQVLSTARWGPAMQKEVWGKGLRCPLPTLSPPFPLLHTHNGLNPGRERSLPACHLLSLHQPGGRKRGIRGTSSAAAIHTKQEVSLSHPTLGHQPKWCSTNPCCLLHGGVGERGQNARTLRWDGGEPVPEPTLCSIPFRAPMY